MSLVSCNNLNSLSEKETIVESENTQIESYVEIGGLELPINGATGYTSVSMDLKTDTNESSETVCVLDASTAFEIIKEDGDWWFIQNEVISGWIKNKYYLVNLPDVVPSVIYDNTNTYSSKYMSSGKTIKGISKEALYEGMRYNERLGKDEYIIPVLYSMAKKICIAQQNALMEGNSLKIYEGFRPLSIQKNIYKAMTDLTSSDLEVMKGVSALPWDINWFIAQGISNHQKGYAIDVSLVKIDSKKNTVVEKYVYPDITNYTEYTMPTKIHELSIASVRFKYPVSTKSSIDWNNSPFASSMNDSAIMLQNYCTMAGLTPLASEWWHFNDTDAMNETLDNSSDGSYYLTECYSSIP